MISARNFWDKAAPRYAKMPIRDTESYEYTLARTRSYLSQAAIALEVGCGTGGTARKLAPHLTHITGTDIAPAMIRIARERCGEEGVANAAFEAADIAGSPVGPFDAVLAHNVLHLVPETEAACKAINEWLAENESLAPGSEAQRAVGLPGSFVIQGIELRTVAQPFRFYLLERVIGAYEALGDIEQQEVLQMLKLCNMKKNC